MDDRGTRGDKNVTTAREKEWGKRFLIEVCGRAVPATNADGIRAVRGRNPIDSDSVRVTDRPDRR